MKTTAAIVILLTSAPAQASECYAWPIRPELAYDGDSIYITMPGMPPELERMEVRVNHIDTPEMHGHCAAEREAAARAAGRVKDLLRQARDAGQPVLFCGPHWDKYGGRIRADVIIAGRDLAGLMLAEGLARPYDGGPRRGWCD